MSTTSILIMKTLTGATALTAVALLAFALAGCAPAADTSTDTSTDTDSGSDSSDTTDESTETETGGFAGVTLSGSGQYSVPDQAPIGGYELDGADTQPDGCTWSLQDADGAVQFENQGIVVFITEVNASFTTAGCPDWVQFE